MSILNYTTSIKVEKTVAEIHQILVKMKAVSIFNEYSNSGIKSISFQILLKGNFIGFKLPSKIDGVFNAMKVDKKIPRSKVTKEQAARVAWRIIKDWVEAQLALIQADLAEVAEIFLPYALKNNGETVYESFKKNEQKMLE